MSRRERVIDRVWDKWLYRSGDFLRIHSPLWDAKVYDRIEDERDDDRGEDIECSHLVAIISFPYAKEPESDKDHSTIDHDRLSGKLHDMCVLW